MRRAAIEPSAIEWNCYHRPAGLARQWTGVPTQHITGMEEQVDTLRVSEDTVIEIVGRDGDRVLFLRNEHSPHGAVILPDDIRNLIECLSVAAGLLAQEAAATATATPEPGTSWAFGCNLGLAQGTCGQYLTDANSRGAAAGLGGCPSCARRIPDNAQTKAAETAAGLVLPLRAYRSGAADEVNAG